MDSAKTDSDKELKSPTEPSETEPTSVTEPSEETLSDEGEGGSSEEEELDELEDVEALLVRSSEEAVSSEDVQKEPPPASEEDEVLQHEKQDEERVKESLMQEEKEVTKKTQQEDVKKEEERREKMKILLSGYLELKAKKEIEKALLNEKKIISQWLYPFRAAYQKQWELDMTKLRLAFQKALDYKKAHVHAIQRERKLSQLNHLWADSAHYQVSEELFDFMRMRCEKLKERYLKELEETKKYYLEREQRILDKCIKGEERARLLEAMRKFMQDNILKHTKNALEKFRVEGEFLREKEMDLIEKKHLTYVKQIAHELQTSISPPEHRMDEIREIFNEWKSKHDAFTQLFSKSKADLQATNDAIPPLVEQVKAAQKRLEALREEAKLRKQVQTEEIHHLQRVSKKYEMMSPSLRKIISQSEDVLVQLRQRKDTLHKIVRLKKFCEELETESDGAEVCDDSADGGDADGEELLGFVRQIGATEIEDQALLKCLYRKLSHVKLENAALETDIQKLKIENKALKSDMKIFFQNIASGEWQQLPNELVFNSVPPDTTSKEKKPSSKEDKVRQNLTILKSKFRTINRKIEETLTK